MPIIKIKTSTSSGAVPANGTLEQGELVANLADEIVWVGNSSGNPVQVVASAAQQDSENVNITGGSIVETAITASNSNVSTLSLSGEWLYYDEGTRADLYLANWSNNTTYNMSDFGGLGNVTAHGWSSGPATYTLSLSGIPVHSEIRYQAFLHYVDSVDNETSNFYTSTDTGEVERLRMRKSYTTPPIYDVIASGTTVSWHGNRFYSYAPWGGTATVNDNSGRNGYVIMDSGWYSHTASTFSARHVLGANQAQSDEAQYISHVKVWIRGANKVITGINTGALTSSATTLSTQAAIKSYVDTQNRRFVKNVYVFTSNGTYNKSGSDVDRIRVICVGGGGGGRGYGESGGAGGYAERILGAQGISSVSVTIGGGGGGGGYFGYSPAGGTTSFGSYISATGGFGANNHSAHIGGHGGNGSNGEIISYGGGGKGHNNGRNNPSNSAVGWGGHGFFGGSRNSHHNAPRPADHGAPGGGGAGSVGGSGGSGSTGRGGICIVYELL